MSKYATENSVLRGCIDETDTNCDYLENIGFDEGLMEELKWDVVRKITKWLKEGANLEDAADIPLDLLENKGRFNNHFHNPLAPWYDQEWKDPDVFDAGLDDEVYMPISYLSTFPAMTPILLLDPWLSQFPDYNNEILHIYGISSLLWAQDGSYQFNLDEDEGDWSWQKIRELYYSALISTTDALRQENFAKVFRGLGHQIHLVQDAAQPDHVRNDGHPWDSVGLVNLFREKGGGFEKWLKDNKEFFKCLLEDHTLPECVQYNINAIVNIDDYMPQVPLDPSQLSLDPVYNSEGLAPSALFIDTDQYDGSNPSTSFSQGISEYTNANFFSDDTIFASERFSTNHRHYFPYPRKESTNIQSYFDGLDLTKTVTARDGILDTRIWISKIADGENIDFFVTMDYLSRAYYTVLGEGPTYYKSLYRDEEAHKDYAKKLIPRAVGYSAGLLDYFFRGTLEITPPDQVAYSVTDGSQTPYNDNGNLHQSFTHIKAKVQNTTPKDVDIDGNPLTYEQIGPGTLVAVAKYKIIPNYNFDLSNYPPIVSPEDNIPDNMRDVIYSYSVSREISLLQTEIESLNLSEDVEFTFDFTRQPPELDQPIPAGITNLSLQIIFKGTLGNEQDIAIAVGMKDLMEPTHQVLWNATDMFQLDGQLYTSDEIINTPSLFDRVDLDDDGQINEVSEGEPYIYPHDMTYSIGYLSAPPVSGDPFDYSAITVVEAGRHIRLISLVDKPQDNYLALEEDDDIVPWTSFFYYTFPGVINQEVNGVWQSPPTPMISFRYGLDIDGSTQIPIRQHSHNDFFGCYPMEGTDPYGNPSCYYPESEAIPAELSPSQIDTVYFP